MLMIWMMIQLAHTCNSDDNLHDDDDNDDAT